MHFLKLLKLHRRTKSDTDLLGLEFVSGSDKNKVDKKRKRWSLRASATTTVSSISSSAPSHTDDLERRLERRDAEDGFLMNDTSAERHPFSNSVFPQDDPAEVARLEQQIAHYDWLLNLLSLLSTHGDPSSSITERVVSLIQTTADSPSDPFFALRAELISPHVPAPSADYSRAMAITLAARRKEKEARKMYMWWRRKAEEVLGSQRELVTPSNSQLGIEVPGRVTPTVSTVSISRIEREWGFAWGEDLDDGEARIPSVSSRELVLAGSTSRELVLASGNSQDCVLRPRSSRELVLARRPSNEGISTSNSRELVLASSTSRELALIPSISRELVISRRSSRQLLPASSSSNILALSSIPSVNRVVAPPSSTSARTFPTIPSSRLFSPVKLAEALNRLSLITSPSPSTATIRLLCAPQASRSISGVDVPESVRAEADRNSPVDVQGITDKEEVDPQPVAQPSSIRAVNFTPSDAAQVSLPYPPTSPLPAPATPKPKSKLANVLRKSPISRPAFLSGAPRFPPTSPKPKPKTSSPPRSKADKTSRAPTDGSPRGKAGTPPAKLSSLRFKALNLRAISRFIAKPKAQVEVDDASFSFEAIDMPEVEADAIPVDQVEGKEERRKSWGRSWAGPRLAEDDAANGKVGTVDGKMNVEQRQTRRLSRLPTLRRRD